MCVKKFVNVFWCACVCIELEYVVGAFIILYRPAIVVAARADEREEYTNNRPNRLISTNRVQSLLHTKGERAAVPMMNATSTTTMMTSVTMTVCGVAGAQGNSERGLC